MSNAVRIRPLALLTALALLVGACAGGGPSDETASGGEAQSQQLAQSPDASPAPEELADEQRLDLFVFFKLPTLDPARSPGSLLGGGGLGPMYLEALLKPEPGALIGEDVEPTGAAAEGYEVSADGLTYNFSLRSDGRYSDGQPVKAADFVYAWRRLIDPRVGAPLGSVFARTVRNGAAAASLGPDAGDEQIDAALDQLGLAALDDRTFRVTLAEAFPWFPWVATLVVGAPVRQDVVERFGTDQWGNDPETLVTNGPFRVAEIGQTATTLTPNPHYRDEPLLDEIVASYGIDPAPRWARYLNDELDVSNGPPPASKDAALQDPALADDIIRFPEASVQWLQFNTAAPPFDNARVRRAVAQAIDRQAYAQVSSELVFSPMTSLVPEGIPGHSPELGIPQEFDPEAARALLAQAGMDPGSLGELVLLTRPPQESDALFFADQIEQHLGVRVTIESIGDSATFNSRVDQGDYQMATTFVGHHAKYPDPQEFFDVFLSDSPLNETGWSNAEYDRLVREADTSQDGEARLELYDQAHRMLVEEAPVAFLTQLERVFYVKPWVRGVVRTPLDSPAVPGNFYATNIWIAAR